MQGPTGVELLDTAAPPPDRPARTGWALGLVAVALVVVAVVTSRPDGGAAPASELSLVGHTGHALDGQQFVRLYFSVAAHGGDAEVEQVELVLGGVRQGGVAPPRIDDGDTAPVLVDVVPRCPGAVSELAAGTLEVTYRTGAERRVARLPLPVQGSLPRLVQRRCADLDRV